MEHILLGLAEFVLVLGSIGIFLAVALVVGLGLAAKAVAGLFFGTPRQRRQKPAALPEVDLLRQRLLDAQTTAYESAVASEKAIQELQHRLHALEAERGTGFVSVRR